MKINEKDVISVVKTGITGNFWVVLSPLEDVRFDEIQRFWRGDEARDLCYNHWLQVTGISLTVRKPVRVRISAEIVPTPEQS